MISIIEDAEVRTLIDRGEAIGVVERAYRAAAEGKAAVSQPASMQLHGCANAGTSFKVKGALLEYDDVAGFRLVGDNAADDAACSSYVYLLNARRAQAHALVSELWLHRLRTAVTALVTCRALAPASVSVISLVGTGRIAEEFVRIVAHAFAGIPVMVASRSRARAADAVRNWQSLTANPLIAAGSIPAAVRAGDIVVTLSDADAVLFSAEDLKTRVLVCALGGRHEFDRDVLDAATHLVVDEIDFVCTAGNGAHWIASAQITRPQLEHAVDATIGEVLLGRKAIRSDGIVLAIIQGMAICDVALAKLAFDRKTGTRT
jgi:ornithine cyclodeaminase/alanine dehydrogenase-like protein (mu-crystallin family)